MLLASVRCSVSCCKSCFKQHIHCLWDKEFLLMKCIPIQKRKINYGIPNTSCNTSVNMISNRINTAQQNCQTLTTDRKKLKAYHFILKFCCSFLPFFPLFLLVRHRVLGQNASRMGRNGSQKLDFREPGSTRTSHHLNHWEGNTKVFNILPVKLWDESQLFNATQENSSDTEANFAQKSSFSLTGSGTDEKTLS